MKKTNQIIYAVFGVGAILLGLQHCCFRERYFLRPTARFRRLTFSGRKALRQSLSG